MKNKLTHFAIYIDDIHRAKSFYEQVFDWGFTSYGPTDFMQIKADQTEHGELIGALQSRKYSPIQEKIIGFECTISVEDVDEIIQKVENNGGNSLGVILPKQLIEELHLKTGDKVGIELKGSNLEFTTHRSGF